LTFTLIFLSRFISRRRDGAYIQVRRMRTSLCLRARGVRHPGVRPGDGRPPRITGHRFWYPHVRSQRSSIYLSCGTHLHVESVRSLCCQKTVSKSPEPRPRRTAEIGSSRQVRGRSGHHSTIDEATFVISPSGRLPVMQKAASFQLHRNNQEEPSEKSSFS